MGHWFCCIFETALNAGRLRVWGGRGGFHGCPKWRRKQYSNHFYLHISASFFLLPLFFISLTCAKITLIDLIFRVDSVCQRYEKYDVQKQRELNAYGDGVFSRLFAAVELEIHAALQVFPVIVLLLLFFNNLSNLILEIWSRLNWED